MFKNSQLAIDIDTALSTMIDLLSSFDEQQINTVPFEGSWTAGQLGQHILLSIVNLPKMLNGPSENTTDRAPDSKLTSIASVFNNYELKMTSPDFIKPEEKQYDKADLIADLDRSRNEILVAVNTLDLSQTSTVFELPGEGFLTRFEWLSFVAIHANRHNHQLRKIVDILVS